MSQSDVKALMNALAAPFPADHLHFKPAVVTGNRALALPYVDARAIQDRLDEVLGMDGWQDEYDPLPDGSVVCKLRCRIGGEWLVKTDVGGPSEQPDGGDRLKAAFSDALKRAAVKFGIGRYLYRLPTQWVDYDPQKRQFRTPPRLPSEPQGTAPQPPASSTGDGVADAVLGRLRGKSPGAKSARGLAPNSRTITDEERAQLTELLVRKGRTPGAALKAAGCHGEDLADLTTEQFRELVARLEKLPDKNGAA
jgi:hypothetical protein